MSHAANALVVIASSIRFSAGSTISSVSVGGAAASKLTAISNGTVRGEVWAIFRPAASTGETVQVNLATTNKQAFVAASFTGTKNIAPFDVATQEATASGTASAVSTTKGAGAKNQRVLNIVANVGTATVSSLGAGQVTITSTGTTGGMASTNAQVELDYVDAPNILPVTVTASLSTAATSASIAIGILPILTAASPPEGIRVSSDRTTMRFKTSKSLTQTMRVADMVARTVMKILVDMLRIKDIATLTKTGINLFTVTVTDKLQILDYHAKTITKALVEQAGDLYDGVKKMVGKIVGCEPNVG